MSDDSQFAQLAEVGIGCARLGEATSGVTWGASVRLIKSAVDGGVGFFDTADAYTNGTSERLLGEALSQMPSEVTIATKAGYLFTSRSRLEARARVLAGPFVRRMGRRVVTTATNAGPDKFVTQDFSPEYLRRAVTASLERLGTDNIDLFQLHAPRGVDIPRVLQLITELRSAGTVLRFGIGVEQLEEIDPWYGVDELDSVQLPVSVLSSAPTEEVIERLHQRNVSVIARSVLAGGLINDHTPFDNLRQQSSKATLIRDLRHIAADVGRSTRSIAIDYVRAKQGIAKVLVGVARPEHLDEVLLAVKRTSSDTALLEAIDSLVRSHGRE